MTQKTLFDPILLGDMELRNRIVMAPMTRSRADITHTPTELMIEYYKQRSNAGLIITEGTSPSANGDGYPRVPGIYTSEQQVGWKKITRAIHQQGSKVFLQLMHVGRIAHSLNKAKDAQTIAPSAVQAVGKMFTDQSGHQDMVKPRALQTEEIPLVIAEYKQATLNAFECGFDGVELHAASGYLPMQFLSSNTNLRTDQYGGSVTNRIRFVLETLKEMAKVDGAQKIGIRIWPGSEFNDIHDADPVETYTTLLTALKPLGLAYVHVIDSPNKNIDAFRMVRQFYTGLSIANGGFSYTTGETAIETGVADLIAYGSLYLANPDLVQRFRQHAPLNQPDPSTFYTPGAKGYTDYPFLANN